MDSIADLWKLMVYVLLPYATLAVLLVGMIRRVRRWMGLPRARATIFPAASSQLGLVSQVGGDILLFRKTFNGSRDLWAMAYLFHLGLALVIVGHLRTVTEVPWFWQLLGMTGEQIDHTSFLLGTSAGLAMLAGAVLLLARRLVPKWRALSLFQDYLLLMLLLLIIVNGFGMRLFSHVDLEEIRRYAIGVLTLHPSPTVANSFFLWHFFFAQMLIMYFPFSKLIHGISKPVTDSWTVR